MSEDKNPAPQPDLLGGSGAPEPTPSPEPSLNPDPTPTPSPSEPFAMVGNDGSLNEGWLNHIGDGSLKDNPTLSNFKTLEGMAKTLINQQSLIKKDHIPKPTTNSSAEEWAAYYDAGGRPESVDKYEVTAEKLEEGVGYDYDSEKGMLEWAHQQGLNQQQANALIARNREEYLSNLNAADEAYNQSMEQAQQALMQEWGGDFKNNLDVAKNAMNMSGVKDMIYSLKLENDPTAIKMLYEMGRSMREDVIGGTDASDQALSYKSELESITQQKMELMTKDIHHPEVAAKLKSLSEKELSIRNSLSGNKIADSSYQARIRS